MPGAWSKRLRKVAQLKVYISGPMTGHAEYNYPAFNMAAAELTVLGHEPVSPAGELIEGWEYVDYLRRSLKLLLDCDAICMLDGWAGSRGARLEAEIARTLELAQVKL